MAAMSARPTRPPTTTPPIVPALTGFKPEPEVTGVGVVEADEEEEEEEEGEVVDEEVMLDVLVSLR